MGPFLRWLVLVEILARTAARLKRRLMPVLQAEGLSGVEIFVLREVSKRRICRAGELADVLGVPPSTFTAVLDRLETRGLVERVPDPGDRRAALVRGTSSLKELLDRVAGRVEEELERVFGSLSDEDYRRVLGALSLLEQHLRRQEEEQRDGLP